MSRRAPRWFDANAAALIAASAAFFFPGLFLGQVPIFRDLMVLVLPLRMHAASAIRSGELPLWTSDLFLGAPFLANYQSAVLYPPSWLLAFLPLPVGFSLYLAVHLFAGGLGASRFLRQGGLDQGPALAGGLVYAFGGFVVSTISLTNHLAAAAWLPWMLVAGERLGRSSDAAGGLRLSLLVALQLLTGAPETALLSILLVAAVALRASPSAPAAGRSLVTLAAAAVLAAGLAAIQLLPAFEYFRHSDRATTLPFPAVAAESLEPVSLLQLALPHTFENGGPGFIPEGGVPLFWSIHVGVATVVVAAASLARPPWLWLGAGLVATAFALGPHLPFLGLLYDLAPSVAGAFRYPAKFFLVAHLTLSLLAGFGLQQILHTRVARRAAVVTAAALGLAGLAVAVAASAAPEATLRFFGFDLREGLSTPTLAAIGGQLGSRAIRLLVFATVSGILVWAFERGHVGRGVVVAVLPATIFLELFTVHQPTLAFTDWGSLRASARPGALGLEAGDRVFHFCIEAGRCVPEGAAGIGPWSGSLRIAEDVEARGRALWRSLVPDVPMIYGLGAVGGSDGFKTPAQEELFRVLALSPPPDALRALAALGVAAVVGPAEVSLPGLAASSAGTDGFHLWLVPGAAPRSYLAGRVSESKSVGETLARFASGELVGGHDAVVHGTATTPPRRLGGGRIVRRSFTRHHIEAEVESSGPGLWVVSDSWFPGWEGRIDGKPVPILHVNGLVRGLEVPGGRHHVEMRYRPSSFRLGSWISLFAALASVAIGATAWRGGRRA